MRRSFFQSHIKRSFDFIVALIGVIILSPVFLIVAILVKKNLGGKIFFTQERIGKNNKSFKMIKFKSMTEEKDENGELLPSKMRVTSFGNKLRVTSLDELPELINVIKGDMSLVGPRPLPTKYLGIYSREQLRRHEVLPGITGWAQVNGRNSISWARKFQLDVWYVDNKSFFLDIRILFLTFYKVFKKENINSGDGLMEAFNGEN